MFNMCLVIMQPVWNVMGTLSVTNIFKLGAHRQRPHTWFLEIALVCASVCVCVCVCPRRPLITSGVTWCDIHRVRLVKQIL